MEETENINVTQSETLPAQTCYNCSTTLSDPADLRLVDNTRYCQPCFDDGFFACSVCGETCGRDHETITADEDSICQGCYEDDYFTCERSACGDVFHHDDCRTIGGQSYCERCFDRLGYYCQNCSEAYYTDNPCDCNSDDDHDDHDTPAYWNSKTKFIPSESFQKILSPRKFGVELESSDSGEANQSNTVFSAVSDGSIDGAEFVSPILQGDAGLEAITALCALNPSTDTKCGFHLHLDATDLTPLDVIWIARGYKLIEKFLFLLVAPSRHHNTYCKKIETDFLAASDEPSLLYQVYGCRSGKPRDKYTGPDGNFAKKRYEFLNVHSFFHRGTLEIRLHQGTFNPEKIACWINLHQALFDIFLSDDYPFDAQKIITEVIKRVPSLKKHLLGRLRKFKHNGSSTWITIIESIGQVEIPYQREKIESESEAASE